MCPGSLGRTTAATHIFTTALIDLIFHPSWGHGGSRFRKVIQISLYPSVFSSSSGRTQSVCRPNESCLQPVLCLLQSLLLAGCVWTPSNRRSPRGILMTPQLQRSSSCSPSSPQMSKLSPLSLIRLNPATTEEIHCGHLYLQSQLCSQPRDHRS